MSQTDQYVQTDEHGVLRVGGTSVMLDSVLAAFEQGHSPETIRAQYPALSLEAVYGAIAYYLSRRAEVEDYLRRQDAAWAKWRAECERQSGGVVEKLRLLNASGAGRVS